MAEDDDQRNPVILIAPIDAVEMSFSLMQFAESIQELKQDWEKVNRDKKRFLKLGGWREKLSFPSWISKIIKGGKVSFKYRHGPIQAALQRYLEKLLADGYDASWNDRTDLAIVQDAQPRAIFEVKTGLSEQIYSGIGQLLVYRYLFASREKVPLFLVLPVSVLGTAQQRSKMSSMLQALGMTLVLQKDREFRLADGRALHEVLDPKWLR